MAKVITLILSLFLISCNSPTSKALELPSLEESPPPQSEDIDNDTEATFCNSTEIIESLPETLQSPAIASDLWSKQGVSRDKRVLEEFLDGHGMNPKSSISELKVQSEDLEIILCVSSDYFYLGAPTSQIRFPLGLEVIEEFIANSFWSIPTKKLVDLIYQQSDIKLSPSTISPGPNMDTTATIELHSQRVNQQIGNKSGLIAGHKKDIVVSQRLLSKPDRIAIYGWHQLNGQPIQSLSTVHHRNYTDYSQGIRLISKVAWLNGSKLSLFDLLSDSKTAGLLSDEGVMSQSLLNKYYK